MLVVVESVVVVEVVLVVGVVVVVVVVLSEAHNVGSTLLGVIDA